MEKIIKNATVKQLYEELGRLIRRGHANDVVKMEDAEFGLQSVNKITTNGNGVVISTE